MNLIKIIAQHTGILSNGTLVVYNTAEKNIMIEQEKETSESERARLMRVLTKRKT